MSKDFEQVNTKRVSSVIATSVSGKGQTAAAGPEEAAARREAMRTQGRKGCRAVRINLAFTDSNHDYVKKMAKATSRTMTEVVNDIIAQYRKEHSDVYDDILALLEKLDGSQSGSDEA